MTNTNRCFVLVPADLLDIPGHADWRVVVVDRRQGLAMKARGSRVFASQEQAYLVCKTLNRRRKERKGRM